MLIDPADDDVKFVLKSGKTINAAVYEDLDDQFVELKDGTKLYVGRVFRVNGVLIPTILVKAIVAKRKRIEDVVVFSNSPSGPTPVPTRKGFLEKDDLEE